MIRPSGNRRKRHMQMAEWRSPPGGTGKCLVETEEKGHRSGAVNQARSIHVCEANGVS